ncbi:acyl carrier protein [Niabella sp.]|uniref:acyl carrier protein n=1 Tax=Niabella sp. TaxID=1962976 RepID=UPI00261E9D2F|nr:acyl carrier protein [Niabella sp.]
MTDYELKNIDPDDISDILVKVEKSFDIKFGDTELLLITTFGELCDHIANKIQLHNTDNCTSQQAFYKLRDAIASTLQIDKKTIATDFSLAEFFPRQSRRLCITKLETHLGFKLNILRPPLLVTGILAVLLLAAFVTLFFDWRTGLAGFIFAIAGFWLANKTGNELDLKTIGQVAEKMTREHYVKSRRNPWTFNKKEIGKILTDWFSDDLGLDKSKLTREVKFV